MSHSLNLWVYAVPSAIRRHVTQMLEKERLARLSHWILRFSDQSRLSSQIDHRFEIHYDDVADDDTCRLHVRLDVPRKSCPLAGCHVTSHSPTKDISRDQCRLVFLLSPS